MDNIEDQFNELVKKADEEKKENEKRVNFIMLAIEVLIGLSGFTILFFKLGGFVTLAVFLILTGNNLQILRTNKKN